jgi:protein involved in polysaccharide export with SLBB domain
MEKRIALSLAMFLLATVPGLHSQDMSGSSPSQQQGSSSDCSNAVQGYGEDCTAETDEDQQQNPQARSTGQTGFPNPTSMGTGEQENAPLTRQNRTISQPRTQPLPPDVPTEFQRFVAASTGQFLSIYGEDLFRRVPSTFSPSNLGPVPSQYVIGPDDELRVRIWGQVNFSGNLRVDRSGDIYLPQVGAVQVAGLPFSALDQHLRAAVSRIYRNFDLSVDIGRIRTMQIYVSGQARRPGAYTISSLSSLVDALFATGGPSPQGSLRHILLNRNGKTVADFDLYALLLRGDKSTDVPLLPEDVLFIPAAGPQVAITGSIRNQGIYELRGGETIGDLIELAGKTTAIASTNSRISLERVEPEQLLQAMEFKFDASGLAAPLVGGDILRIYSILPAYDKTVTLRGFVANPGRFGWTAGMRLSDLIPDRDSLMSRDYWWKRSHLGLPAPEFEPAITSIGQGQQPMEANARGLTTSVTQSTLTKALRTDDQQSLLDGQSLSNQSTGQTKKGNFGSLASGTEETPTQEGTEQNPQDPTRPLKPLNTVRLLSPQINWNHAVIERIDPKTLQPSLISFDLGKLVLDHDPSQNIELQPGDTVTVFSQDDIHVPIGEQVKYVKLEGEFVHPGYYSVLPGETLRELTRRAGGLTPKAYLYGSEFTRESTRILQQQRLDEYVRTVTIESERGTQALAISGNSAGSSSGDVAASREVTQEMIARLNEVKATGRIVLQFRPMSASVNDVPTLALENGDKFIVPFAPATVNVIGAVYDQNSFSYQSGRPVAYYLRLAGGSNRNADWRHTFVIHADGSVISRDHAKSFSAWSNSFESTRLNPGDTIIVPDKTMRPTALRGFMDWTQVFSQMALGAAAIHTF